MEMRRFCTIVLVVLLAGCGRAAPGDGGATELAANGPDKPAGEGNRSEPPSGPADGNGASEVQDNGYSTVPPGNSCGSRTVAVDCPGPCVHTPGLSGCTPTTRTCEQVVPGPPCAGPAPPAAAPKPAGTR